MGIRCTQVYGLSDGARALVADMAPVPDAGSFPGMFDEEGQYPLNRWVRQTDAMRALQAQADRIREDLSAKLAEIGRAAAAEAAVYTEYVQAEPWSSGPCIFTALRGADGEPVAESLWADRAIDVATGDASDDPDEDDPAWDDMDAAANIAMPAGGAGAVSGSPI